jgi:hypothetical protein
MSSCLRSNRLSHQTIPLHADVNEEILDEEQLKEEDEDDDSMKDEMMMS